MSVCMCVAAAAKDSVFHDGRTLTGEKALKGKGFNSCKLFYNFNLAYLEVQWTCRKRKESVWSLAEQNVSGLVFSFPEGKCMQNQVYEKKTKFTGLIVFSKARRALLPSSLL